MSSRRRRGGLWRASIAVLGVIASTAPEALAGQSISGRVTEAGTGRPVVGALVRLVNSDGLRGASFLTAGDGLYRIDAPSPGTYTLLIERIGYSDTRVGPFALTETGHTSRNVVATQAPIELDGLVVAGTSRECRLTANDAGRTSVAWAQVRKALDAATWTKHHGALLLTLSEWQRRRSPGSLSIVDEVRRRKATIGGNSVRSLPPEELEAFGYVRTSEATVDYYGPDAEVLLSDKFLSTHCFGILDSESTEGELLGLTFEPLENRGLPDISGTVWVHRRTGRLDRIDFSYEHLDLPRGQDLAGGMVRYVELPDGRWVVREWYIRAPSLRQVRSHSALGRSDRHMVDAVHETGSEIVSVGGAGWRWSADQPQINLSGTVYDSTSARFLADATVRVAGRGWRTTTDSDGTYEIGGLPEGTYRVVFEHPRLDSLGLAPRGMDVALSRAGPNVADLAIGSRTTLLAETCPIGSTGILVGRVTTPDQSVPVPGATVRVTAEGQAVETVSAVDGTYRLCALPTGASLSVRARAGRDASAEVRLRGTGAYAVADLRVSWSGAATAQEASGLDVVGTVLDAATKRPVGSASIHVLDASGDTLRSVLADSFGRFHIVVERTGSPSIGISSIGYRSATSDALPLRSRRHRLQVELAPEALELEGVVVSVEARRAVLDAVGFYERQRATGGLFLEREDLDLSGSSASEALARAIPGVQRFASGSHGTTAPRVQLRGAVRASSRPNCMPAIYIDGALVRWGDAFEGGDLAGYPTLDELVSGPDIQALEIYETPSAIPARFMGPGSLCGVIVVWTGH
ncbi:MAG: carboxypeptidase regulatory-like domain-containing protein [Longimicrobiales bacterium]